MRDQLRVRRCEASPPRVLSWYSLSDDWHPGQRHWPLLFAHRVRARPPRKQPPRWRDLGWFDASKLRARELGLARR